MDREPHVDGRLLDGIGGVGVVGRTCCDRRQVLEVEAGIAQARCGPDQSGRLAGQGGRGGGGADRADRIDLILAPEVIHDAGDVVERVALVIGARRGYALIDLDRLGVHVARRDRHAAPAVQPRSAHAHRRDDIGLAIGIDVGDDPRRTDGDAHPLERFIEIGAVGGRIVAGEAIVVDHLGGRRATRAVGRYQHRGRQRDRRVGDGDRGRAVELRDRQVGRRRRELGDRTRQRDRIADRDRRCGGAGRDEDRVRRADIAVAVGILDVEAVAAHSGDDAACRDHLAGEQRAVAQALNIVDRDRAGIVVEDRRGRAGGGNDEADRVGQVDDEGLVRLVDPVAVDEDRDRLARLAGRERDGAGLRDIVAACLRGAVRRGVSDARGTDAARAGDGEDRGSGTAIAFEQADIADRRGGIGAEACGDRDIVDADLVTAAAADRRDVDPAQVEIAAIGNRAGDADLFVLVGEIGGGVVDRRRGREASRGHTRERRAVGRIGELHVLAARRVVAIRPVEPDIEAGRSRAARVLDARLDEAACFELGTGRLEDQRTVVDRRVDTRGHRIAVDQAAAEIAARCAGEAVGRVGLVRQADDAPDVRVELSAVSRSTGRETRCGEVGEIGHEDRGGRWHRVVIGDRTGRRTASDDRIGRVGQRHLQRLVALENRIAVDHDADGGAGSTRRDREITRQRDIVAACGRGAVRRRRLEADPAGRGGGAGGDGEDQHARARIALDDRGVGDRQPGKVVVEDRVGQRGRVDDIAGAGRGQPEHERLVGLDQRIARNGDRRGGGALPYCERRGSGCRPDEIGCIRGTAGNDRIGHRRGRGGAAGTRQREGVDAVGAIALGLADGIGLQRDRFGRGGGSLRCERDAAKGGVGRGGGETRAASRQDAVIAGRIAEQVERGAGRAEQSHGAAADRSRQAGKPAVDDRAVRGPQTPDQRIFEQPATRPAVGDIQRVDAVDRSSEIGKEEGARRRGGRAGRGRRAVARDRRDDLPRGGRFASANGRDSEGAGHRAFVKLTVMDTQAADVDGARRARVELSHGRGAEAAIGDTGRRRADVEARAVVARDAADIARADRQRCRRVDEAIDADTTDDAPGRGRQRRGIGRRDRGVVAGQHEKTAIDAAREKTLECRVADRGQRLVGDPADTGIGGRQRDRLNQDPGRRIFVEEHRRGCIRQRGCACSDAVNDDIPCGKCTHDRSPDYATRFVPRRARNLPISCAYRRSVTTR